MIKIKSIVIILILIVSIVAPLIAHAEVYGSEPAMLLYTVITPEDLGYDSEEYRIIYGSYDPETDRVAILVFVHQVNMESHFYLYVLDLETLQPLIGPILFNESLLYGFVAPEAGIDAIVWEPRTESLILKVLPVQGKPLVFWYVDTLTGEYRQLEFLTGAEAAAPSPTEKGKIAAVMKSGGSYYLELYDIDGNREWSIKLENIYSINDIRWSRDGERIAIAGSGGLYIVARDGSIITKENYYTVNVVEWSADSNYVAFTAFVEESDYDDNTTVIVYSKDGRKLFDHPTGYSLATIDWTPYGVAVFAPGSVKMISSDGQTVWTFNLSYLAYSRDMAIYYNSYMDILVVEPIAEAMIILDPETGDLLYKYNMPFFLMQPYVPGEGRFAFKLDHEYLFVMEIGKEYAKVTFTTDYNYEYRIRIVDPEVYSLVGRDSVSSFIVNGSRTLYFNPGTYNITYWLDWTGLISAVYDYYGSEYWVTGPIESYTQKYNFSVQVQLDSGVQSFELVLGDTLYDILNNMAKIIVYGPKYTEVKVRFNETILSEPTEVGRTFEIEEGGVIKLMVPPGKYRIIIKYSGESETHVVTLDPGESIILAAPGYTPPTAPEETTTETASSPTDTTTVEGPAETATTQTVTPGGISTGGDTDGGISPAMIGIGLIVLLGLAFLFLRR